MPTQRPVVLMILDGWGYSEEQQYNAISKAQTPQWDNWWQSRPHLLINASGLEVGLPDMQMGNSEVGHMHIGAGRVIYQDFTRINQAIATEEYFSNKAFLETIDTLKQNGKNLHVMGLLSPGGVHSHEEHLFSFLKLCAQQNFSRIFLHLFLDGRDTPPQSAQESLTRLKKVINKYQVASIASICGRYFAMDRDKRWERTALAYHLLTSGQSPLNFPTAEVALEYFYKQGKTDEFIPPTRIGEGQSIESGDAIFFFNFRADRARQLTQAFIDPNFTGFIRQHQPELSEFLSMTRYASHLLTLAAFPPVHLHHSLGEVLAGYGLSQLRIAETEKYAHVTFFFNGGSELVFNNEDRILIPSPPVATYDLQPEMSAKELTRSLVDAIKSKAYDVIICNYANADMVGHTGDFQATVKAIECLDTCMKEVWNALETMGGCLLITSDHGNAERMFDETTKQAHTAHTNEYVPFVYVGDPIWTCQKESKGSLIDIAPTILQLLDLPKPKEMTGNSLLVENK